MIEISRYRHPNWLHRTVLLRSENLVEGKQGSTTGIVRKRRSSEKQCREAVRSNEARYSQEAQSTEERVLGPTEAADNVVKPSRNGEEEYHLQPAGRPCSSDIEGRHHVDDEPPFFVAEPADQEDEG